jgi:hypothetical protein
VILPSRSALKGVLNTLVAVIIGSSFMQRGLVMKTHPSTALGVFGFGLGAFMMAGAHAQVAPPVYEGDRMLGPTSADATGKDFTDAKGRRWIPVGKVVPKEINVAETEAHNHNYRPAPPPPPQTLPVQYLAEKLRPRRLVGGYEYRLEQPDSISLRRFFLGGRLGRQTASDRRMWLCRSSL